MADERVGGGGCASMCGHRAVADVQGSRDFYRFLASCFLFEPSSDLLDVVRCDEVLDNLAAVFGEETVEKLRFFVADSAPISVSGDRGAELDSVRLDYHALFKTPAGRYVTPYESVYADKRVIDGVEADGLMMGPAYRGVRAFMSRIGFDLAQGSDEPADFVGNELQLVAELCEMEARAREAGQDQAVRDWREARQEFLREHLSGWLPGLAERVRCNARTGFYPVVSDLARLFVTHDLENLERESRKTEA